MRVIQILGALRIESLKLNHAQRTRAGPWPPQFAGRQRIWDQDRQSWQPVQGEL